jgi:hypothetical protein
LLANSSALKGRIWRLALLGPEITIDPQLGLMGASGKERDDGEDGSSST